MSVDETENRVGKKKGKQTLKALFDSGTHSPIVIVIIITINVLFTMGLWP